MLSAYICITGKSGITLPNLIMFFHNVTKSLGDFYTWFFKEGGWHDTTCENIHQVIPYLQCLIFTLGFDKAVRFTDRYKIT